MLSSEAMQAVDSLKRNLKIQVSIERGKFGSSNRLSVKILFDEEVICSDSILIDQILEP